MGKNSEPGVIEYSIILLLVGILVIGILWAPEIIMGLGLFTLIVGHTNLMAVAIGLIMMIGGYASRDFWKEMSNGIRQLADEQEKKKNQ